MHSDQPTWPPVIRPTKYPESRARRFRKWRVAHFGRLRPVRAAMPAPGPVVVFGWTPGCPLPPPEPEGSGARDAARVGARPAPPAYRRVSWSEQLTMWELHDQGLSAREIGRRIDPPRDHHTVRRWLTPERGFRLAQELVFLGDDGRARLLATRLGDPWRVRLELFRRLLATPPA